MQFFKTTNQLDPVLRTQRLGSVQGLALAVVFVVGLVASSLFFLIRPTPSAVDNSPAPKSSSARTSQSTDGSQPKFPVKIRKPAGPPRCDIGMKNAQGEPITVACSTCHSTRQPNPDNKTTEDLNEFHGSLAIAHGSLSCLSCHNADDYDSLKLADGRRIEFSDVMTLCAQCHGPQMKDYEHGAHGGMTGYWDLSRGPRTKNNCIDCHPPHAPQFPKMMPTFKPRDRFLGKESH